VFLALAAWFIRGRRTRSPRCPKCWYDMSGAKPLPEGAVGVGAQSLADAPLTDDHAPALPKHGFTCPECGHTASSQAALLRPRRFFKTAALCTLIAVLCGLAAIPRLPRRVFYALAPTWRTTKAVIVPGYDIRILEHTDPEEFGRAVEIKDAKGHVVFHLDGMYFSIGDAGGAIGAGRSSMTGDADLGLVITSDTGGSGCQQTHYVFSLGDPQVGPSFTPLAVLDSCGYFEDRDKDGVPEFIASDRTFAYRWTSGAASPHPEVILRWHKTQHRYVVAADLMRRAPDQIELEKARVALTTAIPKPSNEEFYAIPLATALNLIYAGNRAEGLAFLRETWPDRANLDAFLEEFTRILDQSPYAAEIRDLQLLAPSAPR
jgi:hypothetical protein